jgi:5-methylcytosine-specific restriction endonuclease McrA
MHTCTGCGPRPLAEFYVDKRHGRPYTVCKRCWKARYRSSDKTAGYAVRQREVNRAYREQNPERVRRLNREWDRTDRGRSGRRVREAARRARARAAFVEDVDPLVVLERDDGVCGICGEDVDPLAFHVDHVIPLASGGEHSYANTQVAHPRCNMAKGARS